jgi:hypothetical protein
VPQFERDEFDQVIRNPDGSPKLQMIKPRPVTAPTPSIPDNFDPEFEAEYRAIRERSKAEREFADKKPKPETIAAVLA